MRKLKYVIHMGTHKTGSTSLQYFMNKNRKAMIKNGVLFPQTGLNLSANGSSLRGNGHNGFIDGLMHQEADIWGQLQQEYTAYTDITTIVLSCENFSTHPELIIKLRNALNDRLECKIIVYLRRQDLYLESLYGEYISGGWKKLTESPEDFFRGLGKEGSKIEQNYVALLQPWADAFGLQNIIVRPFEKAQWYKEDLVQDFFHASALPWSAEYKALNKPILNTSKSAELNKIICVFNKIPLKRKYYQAALKSIFDAESKLVSDNKNREFLSAPLLRQEILEKNKKSNAQIAAIYFGQANVSFFSEPELSCQQEWESTKINNQSSLGLVASAFIEQQGLQLHDEMTEMKNKIIELTQLK